MVPYRLCMWSSEANALTTEVTARINPRTFHDEELIFEFQLPRLERNTSHRVSPPFLPPPPPLLSLTLSAVSSVGNSIVFHRAVDVHWEALAPTLGRLLAGCFTSGLLAVGRTRSKALQHYLSIRWPPTGEPVRGNLLSPLTMESWL